MSKTKIQWATDTWNPITGCSHAGSPGCDHCYARRMAKRLAGRCGYPGSPYEFEVTAHDDKMFEPQRWRSPKVVFVSSMGDFFHEDAHLYDQLLALSQTYITPQHTYLFLTKRPQQMAEVMQEIGNMVSSPDSGFEWGKPWPPPNAWLGVTVETQGQMWRAVELLAIPAAKHFVSIEPCLGPVDLSGVIKALDGVIIGGESGPGARPMHPDWARNIRDQCVAAGVPYTFKQHGEWLHDSQLDQHIRDNFGGVPTGSAELAAMRVRQDQRSYTWPDESKSYWLGKKAAGRELDGEVWDEFPWRLINDRSQSK